MKFKSQVYAQVSGSVGGLTYAHNKAGMYCRARGLTPNPNSPAQQDVRTSLASLVVQWQSLTDAQRAGWATYGQNVLTTDSLGSSLQLSGQQWYIACNSPRLNAGMAIVSDAPTVYSLADLTAPTIPAGTYATTSAISVAYTNTDQWATIVGGALLIQVSRQQPATKNFFKGPFRYATRVNGAATPPTSPVAVTNPYGETYATGNVVFVRVRAVQQDGRISSPIILRVPPMTDV